MKQSTMRLSLALAFGLCTLSTQAAMLYTGIVFLLTREYPATVQTVVLLT